MTLEERIHELIDLARENGRRIRLLERQVESLRAENRNLRQALRGSTSIGQDEKDEPLKETP